MQLSRKEYIESLAKKIVAAGALFFNTNGELLLVKPNYRDHWHIPGGASEVGESPLAACKREVKEELDLNREFDQLLCVDHVFRPDVNEEILLFVFHGGILSDEDIAQIKLQQDELTEFVFVPIVTALPMVGAGMAKRLPHCLDAIKTRQTALM